MKLYYATGACSLSPHIVLAESGLDYETEQVDLRTHKTAGGLDYHSINPKGYVPALQLDGGIVLTEGPAIVQYVADHAPHARLAPPCGSIGRARVQEWLNYTGTELHKNFSPFFDPTTSDDAKAALRTKISRRLALPAQALAEEPYLCGDEFGIADAYLFTVLRWTGFAQIDLGPYPSLHTYLERIYGRPAVQQALAEEGDARR